MNTLDHIIKKYGIFTDYIEIPGIGRNDLADLIKELDCKIAVEIGVASGDYSEVIMQTNPTLEMYGVDPYESYEGYHDYKLRSTFNKMEQSAHDKLDKYTTYKFIKGYSVQVAKDFADKSIDFIYIDGNHSGEAVKEDIEAWIPKLKPGGIMAGHDFTGRWPSLKKAVINYCQQTNRQLFVLGMERKDLGVYRDTSRSWFFVV